MKKLIPSVIPFFLFLVIAFAYFSPLLEGKSLKTQDITMHQGMSKETNDFRAEKDAETLWVNSVFSGMPTYLISAKYKGNFIRKVLTPFYKIPRPASYLFFNLAFFYILLLLLGCKQWVSFAGALAYGFNSAFFIWIDTGHMTKALTLTYMALTVAGVLFAYNKKMILGGVITAFSLSWMISANHPQITYYAGIMVLILGVTYFIYAIKEKTLPHFFKTSAVLIVAALLAVGTNYSRLATTMEYGKYSTRGQSELTDTSGKQTSGLDKDYILDYSYDVAEAFSAFIPRFKGGGMGEPVGEKSHVYKLMAPQDKNYAKRISQALPLYWGSQPIVGAPFYFGAILIFLFVFGLFVLKGRDKWWLAITVLVAFLLSLGKYFPALSNFMLDYFPGYNKFRDVKNIIVIEQFAMALLGVLAIKEVVQRKMTDKQFMNALKYSFAITGGFALVFALFPGIAGDFSAVTDSRMGPEIAEALRADRMMVLRADAFRSFVFVALAALALIGFWKKKLKPQYAIVIWAVLVLVDMWPVNKKYLNNDDFQSKRKALNPIEMTAADKSILQDKDLSYRVLNLTVNPFSDGTTSYFHKSLGGYHGAKIQRYQELIERGISPDMNTMQKGFSNIKSQADIDNLFAKLDVLNMLNTKYIIHNINAQPILNNNALGNAWFVNNFELVKNADEEIGRLANFNPAKIAIIDKRFQDNLTGLNIESDTTASIKLVVSDPNYLKYTTKNSNEGLAVFSEIYYPKGWFAKVNGKDADILRANYVLRAMRVPAGENVIEFSFQPKTYQLGTKISVLSSLILLLFAMGIAVQEIRKYMKNKKA